jgi:hypothetical protein
MSLSKKKYSQLPDYSSERELASATLDRLAPWFEWEAEVPGEHCSGKSLRIDYVMWPRDPRLWKDSAPKFGVEFKLVRQFDTHLYTAWAAQCVDYAHVSWKGHGRLRIFSCPSPTRAFTSTESGIDAAFLMSRMMWQLGVGELALLEEDGWSLLGQGNHVLWSERRGVAEAQHWSLAPKQGHR